MCHNAPWLSVYVYTWQSMRARSDELIMISTKLTANVVWT